MEPLSNISSETTQGIKDDQTNFSTPDSPNNEIDKILADTILPNVSFDSISTTYDFNENCVLNIDESDDSPTNHISSEINDVTTSEIDVDTSGISELLELFQKQEPVDRTDSFSFIYDTTHYDTNQQNFRSSTEPKPIDNLIYAQHFVQEQSRLFKEASTARSRQLQPTTVTPFEYLIHSSGCEPCTDIQMQNDFACQQQVFEYNACETKKIQIQSEPRSKFRPRTQNESKISSHYLRCEEGVKPEYPTIIIPLQWNFESDINLIEVALVGIDKQPHPYTLDNKSSSETYDDNALIFKQGDPNILYFRLTNEDFVNGYKTFMIELIKSKQDSTITKELIRSRQLEQSMLRFTRIFQVGKGDFQRDEGSEVYSIVMSEAYGDVDVEHIGPRYGPISGQEMVYIVLKGRILKNDLKIQISEDSTRWNYSVNDFTKNGNVIYFLMPPFPDPRYETAKANIILFYKNVELYRNNYLYKGSLDQELAQLRINDDRPTTSTQSLNQFDPMSFLQAINLCPEPSRKSSAKKKPKRLSNKLNG